jgi:hypothetical protein
MDPVAYRRAAAIALVYTGKDDHYRKLFMRIVDRNKNTMCAGCGNLANRRKKCSVCKYNFCGACNSNYKDKNGQTCYYCNKYVCCTCPMVYKTCYWCEYITCDGCRAKDEDVWMCVDCRDRKSKSSFGRKAPAASPDDLRRSELQPALRLSPSFAGTGLLIPDSTRPNIGRRTGSANLTSMRRGTVH